MKVKKQMYQNPEIEIQYLVQEDIITSSVEWNQNWNGDWDDNPDNTYNGE